MSLRLVVRETREKRERADMIGGEERREEERKEEKRRGKKRR